MVNKKIILCEFWINLLILEHFGKWNMANNFLKMKQKKT